MSVPIQFTFQKDPFFFFFALIDWGPKLEQQDPGRNLDKR